MISRRVSVLVIAIGLFAVFLLANCKSSSNNQKVFLENISVIEPYGDLYLCDDFVYRVGELPMDDTDKQDLSGIFVSHYNLDDVGGTLNSQRWRPVEKMPMRWELALTDTSIARQDKSENPALAAVETSSTISP